MLAAASDARERSYEATTAFETAFACASGDLWHDSFEVWSPELGQRATSIRHLLGRYAPPTGERGDLELMRCRACACDVPSACVTNMPCRQMRLLKGAQRDGLSARTRWHHRNMQLRAVKEAATWLNVPSISFQPASVRGDYLAFFRDAVLNRLYNDFDQVMDGREWPPGANALSMAGVRRADNFAATVAQAAADGVPGHVIETGVWRGGLSFIAAKTLEVLGDRGASRRVYIADSFAGIPAAPKDGRTYGSQDRIAHKLGTGSLRTTTDGVQHVTAVSDILNNNSMEWVQRDARRFRLKSSRLRFVPGYFNVSLKALVAEEPDVAFSVVRLDGDTYFSTWDAITVLYPRLSPGGFLLIDDFIGWVGCQQAIMDYRKEHKIAEPLTLIPHRFGEEHIGAYWRKGFEGSERADWANATCISSDAALGSNSVVDRVLPSDMYLPSQLTVLTKADIAPDSPIRSAVMYPQSGPALLGLADKGDAVHRCVDAGVAPIEFKGHAQ